MQTEDLQIILKVAELRSITAAARHLDMRTATASAAIKRVEKSLGAELFIRTTRQLTLSKAGEKFLPHCQQALQMLEQGQQTIKEDLEIIDGELRIALSSDLGRNLVMPWIDALMEQHPQIRVHANISDSVVDFYNTSVDAALRYGQPNDANLYGFKICDVPVVLCASPRYLESQGTPQQPEDLSEHNALLYQVRDKTYDIWTFHQQDVVHKVKVSGDRTSNDADLVRRWCVKDKGLCLKSSLDMSRDLLANRLVTLMPDFTPVPTELWLVFPSRQAITPVARALRDRLKLKTQQVLTELKQAGHLKDQA